MKIKRNPNSGIGAFSGPFCVVDDTSYQAIESWHTQERADAACKTLNEHNQRISRATRYTVEKEDNE